MATYLAFALDKLADLGNSLCRWEPIAQCPRQLFARQAIPMVWDFAEANVFSESSGSVSVLLDGLVRAMDASLSWYWPSSDHKIEQRAAQNNNLPANVMFSTDPP